MFFFRNGLCIQKVVYALKRKKFNFFTRKLNMSYTFLYDKIAYRSNYCYVLYIVHNDAALKMSCIIYCSYFIHRTRRYFIV